MFWPEWLRFPAAELAKEPPTGRFPDWLNLRVQRPKAGGGLRMRGKRGKEKKEAEPQDEQTFHVSEKGCTRPPSRKIFARETLPVPVCLEYSSIFRTLCM